MTFNDDNPMPTDTSRQRRLYNLSKEFQQSIQTVVNDIITPREIIHNPVDDSDDGFSNEIDADDEETPTHPAPYPTPDPHDPINTPNDPKHLDSNTLYQCHRRTYYDNHNAPPEPTPPDGTFNTDRRVEETLILPLLEQLIQDEEDLSIRTSLSTDTKVTDSTPDEPPLRVSGQSGPTVVIDTEDPLLITNTYTTPYPTLIDTPRPRHHAQLMASLVAHRRRWNRAIRGIIIYITPPDADDDHARVNTFEHDWNPVFWYEHVVPWVIDHNGIRTNDTIAIPPPLPDQNHRCQRCPYSSRCGADETPSQIEDMDADGFAPITDYDVDVVQNYHPETSLTPTLEALYPDLDGDDG